MNGEERRRKVRVFLPGKEVRLITGPYASLVGKIVDISSGGARFICESEMSPDKMFDMEIVLPDGTRIVTMCRVVHENVARGMKSRMMYGVEFTSLSDRDRAQLGDFVLRLRSLEDSKNIPREDASSKN